MFDVNREIDKCKIVVIESLSKDEPQTGKDLYDCVLKYKPYFNKEVITEFYEVSTIKDFEITFDTILNNLQPDETILIHVESHGNEDGIGLVSGELIGWKDLFALTRPINEKSTNLLIITMSMCKGGFGALDIEPEKRAPFRALIGTPRIALASHLLECFTIFFQNFANMLDVSKAFNLMNEYMINHLGGISPFWMISAEKQIETILNPPDDQLALNTLAREYKLKYLQRGVEISEVELKAKVKEILNRDYNLYKRHFLFQDIYYPQE